jgi:hypothetical protein
MSIKQLSPVAALAAVDLLTQAAAVVATLLYAVPATQGGLYDIAFALKVTRGATTSSTLGALTISYTDANDSVVQSVIALGGTQAGAAASTNAGNATTSVLQGRVTVNAKAGTNITYAIAYASSGGTAMQYEAHLSVRQA